VSQTYRPTRGGVCLCGRAPTGIKTSAVVGLILRPRVIASLAQPDRRREVSQLCNVEGNFSGGASF